MLAKMILKLLLKATVPLVLMAGVSVYMLSSKGIDPMVLVKQMLPSGGVDVSGALGNARDLVSTSTAKVTGGESSSRQKDTLYRWKDENGVTQFSNVPPVGKNGVATFEVNPNQNVVASMPEKPAEIPRSDVATAAPAAVAGGAGSMQPVASQFNAQSVQDQINAATGANGGSGTANGMITSGEQLPGVAGEVLKGVDVSRILGNLD